MTSGVRTTTDGSTTTPAYRYTAGQADGLNEPSTGYVAGLPPILFLTGGGTAANVDPAGVGATRILDALTESSFHATIAQPNVRWALGGPGTTGSPPGTPGTSTATTPGFGLVVTEDSINDACTWLRANRGCTNDPPILIGISNGWVCSIIYARDNPVSGIVGMLTVTAGKDGYDDPALQTSYGLQSRMGEAWNVPTPYSSHHPADPKYSPFDDIANYPDLRGKVQAWYSCNDPLLSPQQMSFLQRPPIFAEMHNVGDYGHVGVLTISGELITPDPVNHVNTTDVVRFVGDIIAGL